MSAKRRTVPENEMVYLKDASQVNGALGELAGVERQLEAVAAEADADIARIRQVMDQKSEPLLRRKAALLNGLEAYARFNQDLFKERRSIDFTFGRLAFRKSTAIQRVRGVDTEEVLRRLNSTGHLEAIRVKTEPNFEVMADWTPSLLEMVGCHKVVKDTFHVETERSRE